jgi:hypothetical protein
LVSCYDLSFQNMHGFYTSLNQTLYRFPKIITPTFLEILFNKYACMKVQLHPFFFALIYLHSLPTFNTRLIYFLLPRRNTMASRACSSTIFLVSDFRNTHIESKYTLGGVYY